MENTKPKIYTSFKEVLIDDHKSAIEVIKQKFASAILPIYGKKKR